jgi:dolichyl-diphosphooligosaccharide--protein glycosyltransferase
LALLLFGIIYLVLNKYSNYQRNFKLYLRDLDFYLLILAINPIIIAEGIFNLANSLTVYIFKFGLPQNDFPNIYVSISELVHRDLDIIAAWTIGNKYLFLIAVVGLILFAISKFRLFVLLLPILLMGLISLKGPSRFAMFLAPMLGIGLGFLIDWLIYKFSLKEKLNNTFYKFIFDLGIIALISAILIWTNLKSFYFKPAPIMTSFLAKTFINLQKITPPNAWIWTWWDYGYAIQYYARRATFHDGGSQGTPKTYFVALSFTTSSPQVGYNVTKSIAVCGLECIKKLLEEGKTAKQITQMFIEGKFIKDAKNLPPIYWLFTGDEISKFAWISYFGTWNFDEKKGYHHSIREIFCAPFGNFNNTYICQATGLGKFLFEANDFHNAALKFANGKSIPVKFFAIRTPDKLKIFENKFSAYGLAVEKVYTAFKRGNSLTYNWYLTDIVGFKSNFNQMFPLRFWDRKLFEKNYEFYPVGVLYKLK